jgi:ATP-dependent RNA helicase DDX51/DBP6
MNMKRAINANSNESIVIKRKKENDDDFINPHYFNYDYSVELFSVTQCANIWELHEVIVKNLLDNNVTKLFPVQKAVIPHILRNNINGFVFTNDICVSAPTGSGKTLSYVVPIVDTILKKQHISPKRLRALVLLPSRELASQVYSVVISLIQNTNIKAALCTGQTNFEQEKIMLCGKYSRLSYDDFEDGVFYSRTDVGTEKIEASLLSWMPSKIDIMVCTPGRLLEHLLKTPFITLNFLEFLVLDEADRLLGNAYHTWVKTLLQANSRQSLQSSHTMSDNWKTFKELRQLNSHNADGLLSFLVMRNAKSMQRLLFSATLTDNPQKLALLGIKEPLLIKSSPHIASIDNALVQENASSFAKGVDDIRTSGFELPSKLSETICVCDTATRPLILAALLYEAIICPLTNSVQERSKFSTHNRVCASPNDICLIFSSSIESTHRLSRLLQLINTQRGGSGSFFNGRIIEMSRNLSRDQRDASMAEALATCQGQIAHESRVKVIVSTDNLARGIDLPNISLVINYDAPAHARVFVHRVGRTARANRDGHCVTMLKKGQLGSFRKMRSTITKVDSKSLVASNQAGLLQCAPSDDSINHMNNLYLLALKKLPGLLELENDGQLHPGAPIDESLLPS